MSKDTTSQILEERQKTHGDFETHAVIAQRLKEIVRDNDGELSDQQREALDMIVHKVARILNGNPNHKDHWDDIAGYAVLASRSLEKKQ